MTNRDGAIERLARAIRVIEEIRLDLRAMYGITPDEPMPPGDRGRDAQLVEIRDDMSAAYAYLLSEAVPLWAAGNSNPGIPLVHNTEPVIELTPEADESPAPSHHREASELHRGITGSGSEVEIIVGSMDGEFDRAHRVAQIERNEKGRSRFTGTSDDGMPSREF